MPTHQEELEDCVFILNSIANRTRNFIKAAVESSDSVPKPEKGKEPLKENTLIFAALSYSLVQASAFLDEWERQFLGLKQKGIEVARVEKVVQIVEPALEAIRSFTGLRDYRNWTLAHNSRIRDLKYKNAYRGSHISALKVPVTLPDYMLVGDCLTFCAEMVRAEFEEYYTKPSDFVEAHTDLNLPVGLTHEEYIQQKDNIKTEVMQRWKASSPDKWAKFSIDQGE